MVVNADDFKNAGVDHRGVQTWEQFVAAAKEVTVTKAGRMQRAGLSPLGNLLGLTQMWIWQNGGQFYDRARGRWNLSTDYGRAALQRLYDLFWRDQVCSFDLLQAGHGTEDFLRPRLSANTAGVWQISSIAGADTTVNVDGIPTPPLADAHNSALYGDEIAVITHLQATRTRSSRSSATASRSSGR